MPKSVLRAVLGRMQFTLHATRRTPHGASRLVQATSASLVKTRRAPSRHSRDARVYGHTTTAMHKLSTPPRPPSPVPRPGSYQVFLCASWLSIWHRGFFVCTVGCPPLLVLFMCLFFLADGARSGTRGKTKFRVACCYVPWYMVRGSKYPHVLLTTQPFLLLLPFPPLPFLSMFWSFFNVYCFRFLLDCFVLAMYLLCVCYIFCSIVCFHLFCFAFLTGPNRTGRRRERCLSKRTCRRLWRGWRTSSHRRRGRKTTTTTTRTRTSQQRRTDYQVFWSWLYCLLAGCRVVTGRGDRDRMLYFNAWLVIVHTFVRTYVFPGHVGINVAQQFSDWEFDNVFCLFWHLLFSLFLL